MNTENLARAIVHWLAYERLCNREHLLSESMLTVPVGQFLNSTQKLRVEAELRYPAQQVRRGRPRQMDFALIRRGERTVAHVVESKWITDDRDFKQEIFDDLLRLETCEYQDDEGRWFIVAGEQRHIDFSIRNTHLNTGNGQILAFNQVLSFDVAQPRLNVRVADAADALKVLWRSAAERLGQLLLPLSITSSLITSAQSGNAATDFQCLIWQIQSVRNRVTRLI